MSSKGRAKGQPNTPIQIRASFHILHKMGCWTFDEIQKKLLELFPGFVLTRNQYTMWTQSKAMDRQAGKEKFCHNSVWVQQMVLDIKDVLYKQRTQLESIQEPKELGQAISTILKSITMIMNLDAGIADIEELRPDVKEVMKNFVEALKGKR